MKVYLVTATKTLQKIENEDKEKIKPRVVTLMCKRNEAISESDSSKNSFGLIVIVL